MRWDIVTLTVVFTGSLAGSLAAQPVDAGSSEKLRQQIEQLQTQLRDIERETLGKRRVTTIGSSVGKPGVRGLVVRVYDVADLFAIAPPYPAVFSGDADPSKTQPVFGGGGLGGGGQFGHGSQGFGGGGGFFAVPSQQPARINPVGLKTELHQFGVAGSPGQTTIQTLIGTIQQSISPDLWKDNEGGTIASLGTALIITADEQTHTQISDLLDLFRERWGTLRTVSVRAWWIWMSDGELTELLSDPAEPQGADKVKAFGLVKPDAWKALLSKPVADGARAGYQSVITCYNGQTVHTISGGQRLAVTRVTPVTHLNDEGEKSSKMSYRTTVALIQTGAAMQVMPVTNTSGKTVLVDVHSRVVLGPDKAPAAKVQGVAVGAGPQEVAAAVSETELQVHRLSSTVRVPAGMPMLVGGMSFTRQNGTADGNLYLFVQAHVQELRNDQEEELPAPKPADE